MDDEWEAEMRRRHEEYCASMRDEELRRVREGRPRLPVRDPLSAAGIYPIQLALYPVDWNLVLGASGRVQPRDATRPRKQHQAGPLPLRRTASHPGVRDARVGGEDGGAVVEPVPRLGTSTLRASVSDARIRHDGTARLTAPRLNPMVRDGSISPITRLPSPMRVNLECT